MVAVLLISSDFLLVAGRWNKEEHDLFVEGLSRHGKEWKRIAQMIPTRTVVQIRTHAQKYFQKLEKVIVCIHKTLAVLTGSQQGASAHATGSTHSAASVRSFICSFFVLTQICCCSHSPTLLLPVKRRSAHPGAFPRRHRALRYALNRLSYLRSV